MKASEKVLLLVVGFVGAALVCFVGLVVWASMVPKTSAVDAQTAEASPLLPKADGEDVAPVAKQVTGDPSLMDQAVACMVVLLEADHPPRDLNEPRTIEEEEADVALYHCVKKAEAAFAQCSDKEVCRQTWLNRQAEVVLDDFASGKYVPRDPFLRAEMQKALEARERGLPIPRAIDPEAVQQ